MSVHYKFKSSLDFDTITFDGLHISVNDFRKAVIQQKRIGKANDFELQIINAQTKEVYENDNDLIPKNTSLIISRIPQTSKKTKDLLNQSTISACHVPKFDGNSLDLSQMNASEEDKIQAMMAQSTVDYDPRGYQKIRGPGQTGDVPPNYRCYKCHQTGHWIKNCPLPHSSSKKSEMRRNTGIPKSFLQEKATEKESAADNTLIVEKQADVPDELVCSICQDIFRDAVMIPCCGSSFCDDCVRSALLDSEENECPDCKEKGTSPGSLIPNRFLRSSVNTFKNETGYERKRKSNGISGTICNLAINSSEKTGNKSNEKQAELDSVEKSSGIESTKEKVILEGKDDVLKKKNMETIKQEEDKEERQGERRIETNSPKKQLEVVTAQPDISHNSEVQTRSEESFKTVNPSSFSSYGSSVSELSHRLNTGDTYSVRPDSFMRHTKQNHMPHMSYCSNFNSRSERYYYPRDSYNINPAPYSFLPNTRCRQMTPQANIQPYYQGLSGTMETGIIEDPLEAFNRIMKEKERRKEMKRLATDRHRPIITKRSSRDTSPIIEKRNRHRTSPCSERRNRSPLRQEKPSHRNIERDKTVRNHRSHYSNIKRSFSRSNSPPQRRYSKSPRKRSRSRSHPRSHSRDIDLPRHENKSSKYVVQQHHRGEYDRDVSRYKKKSSSHYSEARALSESGPKENRKNSSKMGENGVQVFENFDISGHRKKIPESVNIKETRDLQYELHGRASKVPFYKSEDIQKVSKREEEGKHSVQIDEMLRQEMGKKNRERKRKKEKDEKLEKKSKKEKKEKKKQRHKDEQKKYLEHGRAKRDGSSILTVHIKNTPENENQIRVSRTENSKSYNAELLDEGNETFTPDINSSRSLEIQENDDRLIKKNDVLKVNKTAKLSKDFRYKEPEDNNCSELNTPTSFIDTTPENYVGKWDNFDLFIPNSGDMRVENYHNCEYEVDDQGCSPSMRNETTKNYSKRDDTISRVDSFEYRKPKIEDIAKEARSEISEKSSTRRSSPTLSEAISSSSNSNVDKTSQTKKRRKKGKHKKEKRSSSTESSKMLRKSANKHKKSRSEKRKKMRRNEFQ